MKVVLSRKGMDSRAGGIPSPILPDGTLLSLPIPNEKSGVPYNDPLGYADLILNGEPEEYLRNAAGSHGLED